MKTSKFLLSFLFLIQLPAQVRSEPHELKSLKIQWTDATKKAMSKIDAKYIIALEKLKVKYTKRGDLKAAIAVDTELKKIKPGSPFKNRVEVSDVKNLEDNPDYKLKGSWLRKSDNTIFTFDGKGGGRTNTGSTFKIYYNRHSTKSKYYTLISKRWTNYLWLRRDPNTVRLMDQAHGYYFSLVKIK